MTHDKDFKAVVRARMRETGQRYTEARADLVDAPVPAAPADETQPEPYDESVATARREHERAVGRFFDGERLRSIPVRRKVRASVLLELLSRFEPGRDYPEPEVNEMLGRAFEDYAYLRRELVNYGYLTRSAGIYRLPDRAPVREPFHAQEIPAWEAIWLPRHLAVEPVPRG